MWRTMVIRGKVLGISKVSCRTSKTKPLFSVRHITGLWVKIRTSNRQQSSSNQQAALAALSGQQDKLKNFNIMMQQMLQSQHVQIKTLNQATIDINTKMDNMFTELNIKYDTVSNHIRRIDIQLAQIANSVKRKQGMLPEKTNKNTRMEHCSAIELMM